MTLWIPELGGTRQPKATAIAEAIGRDIAAGTLKAGDKLPPQRDLAFRMGIATGTVTRAYAEARRRGLVTGQVGSGTFVKGGETPEEMFRIVPADDHTIDLSKHLARCDLRQEVLDSALASLGRTPGSAELMEYQESRGMARHRVAGADWIARTGLTADPERIVVTQGAQQALAIVFSALAQPGSTILTEKTTFPPIKNLAAMFNIRVHGVEIDMHGMIPEALEAACDAHPPAAIYCIPTLHNPTGITMPDERRREIARIAESRDLKIVEDDVCGVLPDKPTTPIAALVPDRTWFVTSVSKSLAPGLRVGYIFAPAGRLAPLHMRALSLGWMVPPISAEIASIWMDDGTADRLIAWNRSEIRARWRIAQEHFPEAAAGPHLPHLWLHLPEGWRAAEFAALTERAGVRVAPSEAFTVGAASEGPAVRVSLNAARSRDELDRGLAIVARSLDAAPQESYAFF